MLKIYAIRDKKMDNYMRPMYVPHLIEIQRNIQKILKENKSTLAQNSTDFELYFIGEFDEQHASYTLETKPQFILNIDELHE